MKKDKLIIFLILLFFSLILRLYKGDVVPPTRGLGFEEYQTGEIAYGTIYGEKTKNLEHLITNNLAAWGFKLFGENIWGMRMSFVLIGSLTVPLFYLFLKEIVSIYPALLTTMLLLGARWHILGSRIADELFTGNFFLVLCLFLFMKSLNTRKKLWLILTGIVLSSLTYEYFGYRLALMMISGAISIILIKDILEKSKCVKIILINFFCFLIPLIVLSFPMLVSLYRGNDLLVEGFRRHANGRLGGGFRPLSSMVENNFWQIIPDVGIIKERLLPTISIFLFGGSKVNEFGINLPILDGITAILMACSFIYCCLTLKKHNKWYWLVWFLIALSIGAFFPVNFYPGRFVAFLLIGYIFIAFLLDDLFLWIKKKNKKRVFIYFSAGLFFVCLSLLINFYTLFYIQNFDNRVLGIFNEKESWDLCLRKGNFIWVCNSLRRK